MNPQQHTSLVPKKDPCSITITHSKWQWKFHWTPDRLIRLKIGKLCSTAFETGKNSRTQREHPERYHASGDLHWYLQKCTIAYNKAHRRCLNGSYRLICCIHLVSLSQNYTYTSKTLTSSFPRISHYPDLSTLFGGKHFCAKLHLHKMIASLQGPWHNKAMVRRLTWDRRMELPRTSWNP